MTHAHSTRGMKDRNQEQNALSKFERNILSGINNLKNEVWNLRILS